MSEVILKFAEPLLQRHGSKMERVHSIVRLAVMAWNMSMLPETSEEQIAETLASSLPKELPAENVALLLETIHMLIERRRKHFQNVPRIVVKYEVLETEKGWDLNVSSATVAPKVE